MSLRKVQSAVIADNAITSDKIASGTTVSPSELTTQVNNLIAGAPGALNTLDELAAALGDDANFATTVTNSLATKASITYVDDEIAAIQVTPTQVSDQVNTSTGAFDVPTGTTAQRPSSPSIGMIRYNTDISALENYTSQGWLKVSIAIPSISSISGSIYNGQSTNITLSGLNFGSSQCTVTFVSGGTNATATGTPSNQTSVTVAVPASIYNLSSGSSVNVTLTNSDGGVSNAITTTVLALPSGGTITTSGSYRIHTFNSSSNFVVPSGFSKTAEYLIVAGGGGGGNNNSGGGGAGGMITGSTTISANTYAITIGSGGAGAPPPPSGYSGYTGNSSSALGITAIGGGGGAGGNFGPGGSGERRGYDGGSGGGGSRSSPVGSGTAGQGNSGAGSPDASTGGGGGGKGSAGSSQNGGSGASSDISGSTVFYAGGGGGSAEGGGRIAGTGGNGGGGRGGASNGATRVSGWDFDYGENGATNRGGGGGGGDNNNPSNGGNGGSGIVIIRYTL